MIKKLLFIFLLGCFAVSCTTDDNGTADLYEENTAATLTADETRLINLVNTYRANKNLPALSLHVPATKEAKKHSDFMSVEVKLSHENWSERAENIHKMDPILDASENVAKHNNINEIMRIWKQSNNGHNVTMLGDFTHAGVGIVKCQDGNLWATMIFVKK